LSLPRQAEIASRRAGARRKFALVSRVQAVQQIAKFLRVAVQVGLLDAIWFPKKRDSRSLDLGKRFAGRFANEKKDEEEVKSILRSLRSPRERQFPPFAGERTDLPL